MQDMKVDLMDIVSKWALLNLNFLAPFCGYCLPVSRLQKRHFNFYHKVPRHPGTHLINLTRINGLV